MCQFKSAIVMKNGDLLYSPWTESHEDLIRLHKLRDTTRINFARVEFTPKKKEDYDKPEKYSLRIDEERRPDWFSEKMEEKAVEKLQSVIKRMIIDGEADLLMGGQYILTSKARVRTIKAAVVNVMMRDAQASEISDNAKVGSICGNAKVDYISDNAKVGSICDNAKVGSICGNAKVDYIYDNAKVGSICDNAKVGSICGNAKVGSISDNAKVDYISDNAKVGSICGNAKVDYIYDNAKVGSISDNAKIENDKRDKEANS